MAKFSVAYGLCPLIDSCSLLGVNVDRDEDCVIVTVGKNIVIRYKFQDQKQVSSWSTKDKITSPVIYNSFLSEYCAVFNHNELRMWKVENQLDKVKKYKFQEPLHSVISDLDGNSAFVLFRCGHVASVVQAVEARKVTVSDPILKSSETIRDYSMVTCNGVKFVTFISCGEEDKLSLNVVPVVSGSFIQHSMMSVTNGSIVGHTILSTGNTCFLLTLWSDGSLFSYRFLPGADNDFPGVFIANITDVNTKHPVAMKAISNYHITFFGADISEEGARLILFNMQFQLIQARLHFKLYTKPPRIWNVNDHLLVTVGNSLIAVPYVLEEEQLSTLIGIHSSSIVDTNDPNFQKYNVEMKVKCLQSEGLPQASILQKLFPDILKKKDTRSILWCLKSFTDIPESFIVRVLVFCFSSLNPMAIGLTRKSEKVQQNGYADLKNEIDIPTSSYSENCEHTMLIDTILNKQINDMCIIPHLRGVPFVIIMNFLNYLNHLMDRESYVSPLQVIEWLCLILDSHYQEYLLSHNQQVVSLLTSISEKVYSQIEYLEELKKLSTLLYKLHCGKNPFQPSDKREKKYSVEILRLY